mmetsp:Transcript_4694/g.7539  ORF Transcript_4694/g.7539 Transcript_4694/m.7539 type:complete len:212 (+) Transcript_4694:204-839(+)
MARLNYAESIFSVHGLFVQPKIVQPFAFMGFVGPEPLPHLGYFSWHHLFHILNIVQLCRFWVVAVNRDHLPVSLAIIDHAKNTERLDGGHRSRCQHFFADLHHVHRISVANTTSILVRDVRVLPGLGEEAIIEDGIDAIVTKLAFLGVLQDGIAGFLDGCFHLGPGSPRDLNNIVKQTWLLWGKQRNIVPRRDGIPVLLEKEAVLESFLST